MAFDKPQYPSVITSEIMQKGSRDFFPRGAMDLEGNSNIRNLLNAIGASFHPVIEGMQQFADDLNPGRSTEPGTRVWESTLYSEDCPPAIAGMSLEQRQRATLAILKAGGNITLTDVTRIAQSVTPDSTAEEVFAIGIGDEIGDSVTPENYALVRVGSLTDTTSAIGGFGWFLQGAYINFVDPTSQRAGNFLFTQAIATVATKAQLSVRLNSPAALSFTEENPLTFNNLRGEVFIFVGDLVEGENPVVNMVAQVARRTAVQFGDKMVWIHDGVSYDSVVNGLIRGTSPDNTIQVRLTSHPQTVQNITITRNNESLTYNTEDFRTSETNQFRFVELPPNDVAKFHRMFDITDATRVAVRNPTQFQRPTNFGTDTSRNPQLTFTPQDSTSLRRVECLMDQVFPQQTNLIIIRRT